VFEVGVCVVDGVCKIFVIGGVVCDACRVKIVACFFSLRLTYVVVV
jgi:hypothetical protein